MKKFIAIALLISSVNIVNGASWTEMMQEALTGKPATVATAPASGASTATAASNQLNLDQIKNTVPSLIENIKLVVAKLTDVTTKATEGGFFSGIKAAFSDINQSAAAFSSLTTQAATVAMAARSLLNTADPQTKAVVQDLVAQVVQIPEFQKLLEYVKNTPFGGQLTQYLDSLKQEAAGQ